MVKVHRLEREVQKLNPEELAAFREWFQEYDSDAWDRRIEKDIQEGNLDKLAEGADEAHKTGRTTKL